MPDGEVRLYCTRIAQVISYFTEDGEGGSVLWLEPGEMAIVQDGAMDEIRTWILGDIAQRLQCTPDQVEAFPLETLCTRLKWTPDPPRHPWQVQRSQTPARRMSR
ncbi:hypothetical protein [Hyphomicrobium sp.]|uniref:hypothetical protein n=1 Tax=Hyphomicrobium sp. TaxID=82 RepID=UPI002E2F254D|nr:hypothetical protein [Hyphomicrobium sp.]HEX2842159.1 hypothetical protein [Hyphomicrobium sp.]